MYSLEELERNETLTASVNADKGKTVSMVSENKEILLSDDTSAVMKSFIGKYYAGKVYLKWVVAKQRINGTYIIYRSVNGTDYEMAGYKQGTGCPYSGNIGHYFTDENPVSSEGTAATIYYKILHVGIGNNNTFLLSSSILVR